MRNMRNVAATDKAAVNEADPRVKRTRKLLQDALVDLLAEKSFDAITINDIAARSTINRATFYAHFSDKYDLFAQFSREWFRDALDQQLPPTAPFTPANFRLLVRVTLRALADINDHCRPTEALKPLIMAAVQEELARLLRGWLVPLTAADQLDSTVAAVSWALFGAAHQWSQAVHRAPLEDTALQIASLLTRGLPKHR